MPVLEQFWSNVAAPLTQALGRRPKWEVCIGSILLTFLILAVDHSLPIFLIIPISIMAWYVGPVSAFTLAVFSAILWGTLDYSLGLVVAPARLLLHGFFRVMFYAFFVAVLVRLHHLQQNLRTLAEERAQALADEAARTVRLEREMLEAGEREQRRIGQDLHDGLCQHLTGTALASQVLAESLGDLPQAENARKLVDLIEGGINLARDIAKGLYPIAMQNDGLMRALEDFTANTSDVFGIACRFSCDLPVLVENPSTAAHLYRIAQEAVSNAVRHGGATEIEISLDESDSDVRLRIADNGSGLPDPILRPGGMGLRTMADRARSCGGQFAIHAGALGGAEVVCVAPGR